MPLESKDGMCIGQIGAARSLVYDTKYSEYSMEETIYHSCGSSQVTHWKILFHCDNQAVVNILEKGSTSDPDIMALVWLLYFHAIAMFVSCIFLEHKMM